MPQPAAAATAYIEHYVTEYIFYYLFFYSLHVFTCAVLKGKYSQKDGGNDSILCMVNQLKNQASLFRPFVVGPFALYILLFCIYFSSSTYILIFLLFPKSVLYFSTFSFNLSGFCSCLIFLLLCHLFLFSYLLYLYFDCIYLIFFF